MDIDSFLDNESKDAPESKKEDTKEESQIDGFEDLDSEISAIKSLMLESKFEEAEKKYLIVKEQYAKISKKFIAEQNRIYAELESINANMVTGLSQLKEESKKKVQIIRELMQKAQQRLINNELSIANQLYAEIEQQFKLLPEVIASEKISLEQELVKLHVELSNKTNIAAGEDFNVKFSNIRNLLTFALENVNRGNITEAAQLYQKINETYEQLPRGFLIEKAMLYQQILKLFKEVQHKTTSPIPPKTTPGVPNEKP